MACNKYCSFPSSESLSASTVRLPLPSHRQAETWFGLPCRRTWTETPKPRAPFPRAHASAPQQNARSCPTGCGTCAIPCSWWAPGPGACLTGHPTACACLLWASRIPLNLIKTVRLVSCAIHAFPSLQAECLPASWQDVAKAAARMWPWEPHPSLGWPRGCQPSQTGPVTAQGFLWEQGLSAGTSAML